MPRYVSVRASALVLLFSAACSSSNPAPQSTPAPNNPRGTRAQQELDSLRRNTVIENDRPDLPARTGVLVVANQQAASATILNATTLKTIVTLKVGLGPHEVAVSPDGRWAVVTNYGTRDAQGNTLSVIDLSLVVPVVSRTIDLGEYHRPHGAAFVANGSKLVVTSESSQRLVLVDFTSGKVDTALATNGRGAHMVTVTRDGRHAWTANIADGTVTEYDLVQRVTGGTFPAAPNDEGIAVTPGGTQVWVGSNTAHSVTVLDTREAKPIATLDGFGTPYRIGITRSGRLAVVNDPASNRIWVYEVPTRDRVAEIDLGRERGLSAGAGGAPGQTGAGPEGVTFDPIADFAYVTLSGTNQVVAVDLAQLRVAGFGSVGAGPDGIGYSALIVQRP
ncbi:MAG: YncE family protein [Gemmatimonadota bacterium]|nr:YncE family protein [Gemmatimonadota bacterium]